MFQVVILVLEAEQLDLVIIRFIHVVADLDFVVIDLSDKHVELSFHLRKLRRVLSVSIAQLFLQILNLELIVVDLGHVNIDLLPQGA